MSRLVCPLCPYERTAHLHLNITGYLKHIKLFHSHQPSFSITCGLGGCLRTFRNFQVFRNHVSTFHAGEASFVQDDGRGEGGDEDNIIVDGVGGGDDGETGSDSAGHCFNSTSPEMLQRSSALFVLGLKEKHKLTQATIQGVIQGVTGIMQCHLSAIRDQIRDQLSSSGVSPETIALLNPLLSEDGTHSQPFHGLETPHQQLSFYRTHFNFIVCGNFK